MSARLRLRDYQLGAIEALHCAWRDGMRRPAVVLPTGAGKTVVFSALTRDYVRRTRDAGTPYRAMVLVHRDELADQAIDKLRAAAPDLVVGKVKAESDDVHADVMVCSVQTVSRPGRLRRLLNAQTSSSDLIRPPSPVGLIITDECHHGAAPSYGTVYGAFPHALHAGFTATLERGDGKGLGSVWDDVVYSRSILNLIKQGHLVQPRAFTEDMGALDLSSVKTTGGDYQSADLGRALEDADVAPALPKVWLDYAPDRPTIVFTPTVDTAHGVAQAFADAGIPSGVVSGETPREERQKIYDDFRTGRIKILSNCMVLTEGFDAPWASCVIVARPTRSRSLYIQMVGRVLRPWHDKHDAIVINVSGAGGQLATLVDLAPGQVEEVKDGEGLLEAEERELEELEQEEALAGERVVRARIQLKEASALFAASHQAWLSTAGGVQFLSAGEWTYFLWPSLNEPGKWDVLRRAKRMTPERTPHRDLDIEMAMSWAEAEAEDNGSFSLARSATWRRGKPTDAMIRYAETLGIEHSGLSKAELSDATSVAIETGVLDQYIGRN